MRAPLRAGGRAAVPWRRRPSLTGSQPLSRRRRRGWVLRGAAHGVGVGRGRLRAPIRPDFLRVGLHAGDNLGLFWEEKEVGRGCVALRPRRKKLRRFPATSAKRCPGGSQRGPKLLTRACFYSNPKMFKILELLLLKGHAPCLGCVMLIKSVGPGILYCSLSPGCSSAKRGASVRTSRR